MIQRVYDLTRWAIPQLERFPRSQRPLLGDHVQRALHALLDELLRARYAPARARVEHLDRANLELTRLRVGLRLARDLGHLRDRSYLHAAGRIERIGRELGGWRRSCLGRSGRSGREAATVGAEASSRGGAEPWARDALDPAAAATGGQAVGRARSERDLPGPLAGGAVLARAEGP